jgi:hypothetical protein
MRRCTRPWKRSSGNRPWSEPEYGHESLVSTAVLFGLQDWFEEFFAGRVWQIQRAILRSLRTGVQGNLAGSHPYPYIEGGVRNAS